MFPFGKKPVFGDRGEPVPEPNDGPPDSHRPSGLCPRCNKQSSFEVLGSLPVTFDGIFSAGRDGRNTPMFSEQVSSLQCRHCNQCVVVVEEQWTGEQSSREVAEARRRGERHGGGVISFRGVHWWPLPIANVSTDVPLDIVDVYSEACLCLSAGAFRAAAGMARRTLEAITVDKNQTTGTLHVRLQNLSNNGVLHPSLTEWIKEVRLIGNVGAHFDPMKDPVTKEDADDLLKFIRELLRYLYEMPAELNRRRAGR